LPSSNKPSGSSASTFLSPDKNRDQANPLSQIDDGHIKQPVADMEDFDMEGFVKELEVGLMKTFGGLDEDDLNNDNVGSSTTESKGTSFQDKINQTMNKLQTSSEQLDVCVMKLIVIFKNHSNILFLTKGRNNRRIARPFNGRND
jgi:hypothetical protein